MRFLVFLKFSKSFLKNLNLDIFKMSKFTFLKKLFEKKKKIKKLKLCELLTINAHN